MDKGQVYTHQELTNLLKEGSPVAFNRLLDRYSPGIFRFAMSYLRNSREAEEIVQEVFLKLWKIRESLSPEKSIDSLLFTMAKNGVLNTIRKARSQQAFYHYAGLFPQKNILVEDELDFRELEKILQLAITRLSPGRQMIFRLKREQYLSNAEIARQLGISVKTVENQVTAALAEIRRFLSAHGFTFLLLLIFFDGE